MARLYADENFPMPVVHELRTMGHDVLTVTESAQAGLSVPDDQVLLHAIAGGRAVLTLNRRHFIKLHALHPGHSGFIACTFDPAFSAQAKRIDAAVRATPSLKGVLIRINRPP